MSPLSISLGCQVIMRYLARQSAECRIGGTICIGGWFDIGIPDFGDIILPWCDTKTIDFERLKQVSPKILCFMSDDDSIVALGPGGNEKQWRELLPESQIDVQTDRGHFVVDALNAHELEVIDNFLGV